MLHANTLEYSIVLSLFKTYNLGEDYFKILTTALKKKKKKRLNQTVNMLFL